MDVDQALGVARKQNEARAAPTGHYRHRPQHNLDTLGLEGQAVSRLKLQYKTNPKSAWFRSRTGAQPGLE